MQPIIAIVASGFSVSGDIDLRQRTLQAIFCPTLAASGDLSVQANMDTTSGNYLRMLVNSVDLRFPTGIGSRAVIWPSGLHTPAFARIEIIGAVGSMQTDNRTFVLQTNRRV